MLKLPSVKKIEVVINVEKIEIDTDELNLFFTEEGRAQRKNRKIRDKKIKEAELKEQEIKDFCDKHIKVRR